MIFGLLLTGSTFSGPAFAEKLQAIRCEVRQEVGENPSELLKAQRLSLGAEPEAFTYSNDEKGLDVIITAMSADDDSRALVTVGLTLNGYTAESQFFTDGKEITDVSIAGPGEPKIIYVASCFR